MSLPKRIGILTSGGDCPGLNAVIRAVTKTAANLSSPVQIIGISDGYAGLMQGRVRPLNDNDVSGILPRGGTILGTSNRDNIFSYLEPGSSQPQDRSKDAIETLSRERLDGLITVGGEGTLTGALRLSEMGVPVIGVPKTIDNDLNGTDVTFGFNSALAVATEAIDRLHTTAESHHRVLLCEVMGRYVGWIALHAGVAGGGDVILLPEIPFQFEHICQTIEARKRRGKRFSIVVVSEGAVAVGGQMVGHLPTKHSPDKSIRLGGISHHIAREIEERLDIEARVVILGHLQRGGTPSPFDRWLATQFGVHAVELALKGQWGTMTALRSGSIAPVPIKDAVATLRRVDPRGEEVRAARRLGTAFGDGL